MIVWEQFLSLVTRPSGLARPIDRDQGQLDAVQAEADESLFIMAGPGSGKTTVLTLRVLKLVFVDDVDPASILATTFTRKAATELRSRIVGWGDRLRRIQLDDRATPRQLRTRLERLDLNRVVTGTLDSLAEQVLGDYRTPGTQPPVPLEEFVASALMQRFGLWQGDPRRDRDQDMLAALNWLTGDQRQLNQPELVALLRELRDRFLHDQVDIARLEGGLNRQQPGIATICRTIEDYAAALDQRLVMDFAALEQEFLRRLEAGQLNLFTNQLRAVLVDEYQDTNLLQEQIYFALARTVRAQGGSITVVGDDDQSLYRFRGATVELFAQFPQRLTDQCGITPRPIDLSTNYRSTANVVSWYTTFLGLDRPYQAARVPGKAALQIGRAGNYMDYPVLGLFRPDVRTLAQDVARFIAGVFSGRGVTVRQGNQTYPILRDPTRGAVGDCALLCSSPRELGFGDKERLPLLLRQTLAQLPQPIQVFNPRGRELRTVPEVACLCGLMLECIDPEGRVQNTITNYPPATRNALDTWRQAAQAFIATNPAGPATRGAGQLSAFVRAWQSRRPQSGGQWPREVPLIDLVYKLIAWIPAMQSDPEGLVYLEVITRTITEAPQFNRSAGVIRGDAERADQSIRSILWDIFQPLASGMVDVDEELIETFPRDRLNVLSIHQAKGLEFPLVIVDVASEFRIDHRMQAFKRFPTQGGRPHSLEDRLRPFSPLGPPGRTPLDRAFDDLVRQYFVAFSRSQDVLLLIGLGQPRGGPNPVPNVATSWTRARQSRWAQMPGIVYL